MALVFAQQTGGAALVFWQQPYGRSTAPAHRVEFTDTAPRLWWQRKPKSLDDAKAEKQVAEVVRVIERVARKQAESAADISKPAKAQKAEVRDAIAPLVADMPGFDWTALYRFILAKLAEQHRQQAEQEHQAMLIMQQAIARMRDEDDLIILLMGD
jgi:hypothetical protein